MAEFNSAGFSAVAQFFGQQEQQSDGQTAAPIGSQLEPTKRSRHGVGSSSTTKLADTSVATTTAKRVLAVGKRSQFDRDDSDSEASRGDEEEEEGRTAIARRPVPQKDVPVGLEERASKKRKKKKGKKERHQEASHPEVPLDAPAEGSKPCETHETESDPRASDQTNKKRRKKPKVRSRQKNIYKDHRLAQHKPDHLILGRPDFAGRPLTPATRLKLNLPPSRSSKTHDMEGTTDHADIKSGGGEGMMLAVDELLDVGELQKESAARVDKPPDRENLRASKTKKKKSKYKNLQ